ncbi:hypothetical protein V8E54_011159 [Elaphomyces granulatus]
MCSRKSRTWKEDSRRRPAKYAKKAFFGPETTETSRKSAHASPVCQPKRKEEHARISGVNGGKISLAPPSGPSRQSGKIYFTTRRSNPSTRHHDNVTHSRIHRQPPLYKATNGPQTKSIRACICIITTIEGHIGWPSINPHSCPRNNSDRTWKQTLRGSTRRSARLAVSSTTGS